MGDEQLADKICKAIKLEIDEEMLQASDEALAEAEMDLQDTIDDDFEDVDSDVRFTTLALLEQMDKSPEFLQSKNKNIIKKGIAMAKGAIKFVKGKAGEYSRLLACSRRLETFVRIRFAQLRSNTSTQSSLR